MPKPRLTKKVIDGLRSITPFIDVNLYDESDLLANTSETEEEKITAALGYLEQLIRWYDNDRRKKKCSD